MQHARDRIRELTVRRRLLLPVETVVQDINMFLRGWAGYFRYGHSADRLQQDQGLRAERIAIFIGKRHRRSRHFGMWALSPLAERVRPDQPLRNRCRTQGRQALAGETECRR